MWVAAPMKNNIGIENTTLVREARNARRAAAGAAGFAWAPAAVATAFAITICCFRQITPHTFTSMIVPSSAPVRMAVPQGLVATELPAGASPNRFAMIRNPERNVSAALQRNHHSARGARRWGAALLVAACASAKKGPWTQLK